MKLILVMSKIVIIVLSNGIVSNFFFFFIVHNMSIHYVFMTDIYVSKYIDKISKPNCDC